MKIDDLKLHQFGITLDKVSDKEYKSDIIDSNLFQDLFDYFNGVSGLELDEDSVEIDETKNDVTFKGENIEVELKADFDNDKYQIIVRGDN